LRAGGRPGFSQHWHASGSSQCSWSRGRPAANAHRSLELDHLPPHLIVLGAGYVGLELAQAYRRFGSRVTVIERGPRLMSREDPDVADEMQRILGNEGFNF
jgi:pyruvate/2-oxoglutarate dehydrogenase complex dihydrolipoamide dehydrogenase (E3) component